MSDLNTQVQTMQRQINLLEAEIRWLKAIKGFGHLSSKSIVGANYVMVLFGCTESAVRRGRASYGTIELRNKRVRFNPDGWLKEDVDAAHKDFIKTAPARAMEAERAANTRNRRRRAKYNQSKEAEKLSMDDLEGCD